jgi:hypothetical protein
MNADIVECDLDPSLCEPNGDCENTGGSYECNCDTGWDGRHCSHGKINVKQMVHTANGTCNPITVTVFHWSSICRTVIVIPFPRRHFTDKLIIYGQDKSHFGTFAARVE